MENIEQSAMEDIHSSADQRIHSQSQVDPLIEIVFEEPVISEPQPQMSNLQTNFSPNKNSQFNTNKDTQFDHITEAVMACIDNQEDFWESRKLDIEAISLPGLGLGEALTAIFKADVENATLKGTQFVENEKDFQFENTAMDENLFPRIDHFLTSKEEVWIFSLSNG